MADFESMISRKPKSLVFMGIARQACNRNKNKNEEKGQEIDNFREEMQG